jgi:hypothetical protein
MGFGGSIGFGTRRFSKVRCGFTSRASSASRLASISSMLRQRLLSLKTLDGNRSGYPLGQNLTRHRNRASVPISRQCRVRVSAVSST